MNKNPLLSIISDKRSLITFLFFISCLFAFLLIKNHEQFQTFAWAVGLSTLGLLGTREEMGFLIAAIGLMVFFKGKIKEGLILFLTGLFSSFVLIYFFLPFFSSQGKYIHFGYGEAGETPIDVVIFLFTQPFHFFKILIFPLVKLKTVILSLASFGFLPLFFPISLIPVCQQFIIRFIDTHTTHRWFNRNHFWIIGK